MLILLCLLFLTSVATDTTIPLKKAIITIDSTTDVYGSYPKGSTAAQFTGYLVKINPIDACKAVTVQGLQADEENANNFITYTSWDGPCTPAEKLANLANANITNIIFYSRTSEEIEIDSFVDNLSHCIQVQHKDVVTLDSSASTLGNLVSISIRPEPKIDNSSIPMSSMAILFVTVAFVTLMTVSIGWLVFYYAQRCRQNHIRERIQSRLCTAAKRAVSKLPTRTIPDHPRNSKKSSKKSPSPDNESTCSSCNSEEADFCPVCLELYKPREVIRILPCRHEFHKHCVDPWLVDHRTCPMCKLDILEALGVLRAERTTAPPTPPAPTMEVDNNISLRVDQEVQTDFVDNNSSQSHSDEITPAPPTLRV